ncbi:MAG TPA: XdhC family protein [Gemmatimonadaceae bacterium]|jgi:xanthine dehydrogenase accessory factor
MSELLEQFTSVEASGRPAALATLVAAAGATPKKAGSTMWVSEQGDVIGSVTIGGCVDARVIEQAERVIASGKPELLRMTLGDEDAWELGLTCGGEVDVLVQRVDPVSDTDPSARAYALARDAYESGRASMVVSRLDGRNERLVVDERGATRGTLGDAGLDEDAVEVARARLAGDQMSAVERVRPEGGDEVPLFFERLAPPETLIICGASHVAMSLAVFARELGMRTVIVDGRERMATKSRFPTADEIHVGMPSEITEQLRITRRSYVALLAHDYKYDLPVLREVLRSDAGYVGMLGSRRRGETIRSMLREEGFSASELARLHSPIGLAIGAKSAGEIALAIVAEIVAVREGRADSLERVLPNAALAPTPADQPEAMVR